MKKIFLFVCLCLFLISCSTYQKAKVADILSNTKFELTGFQLDSVNVSPDLFEKLGTATKSLLPNPKVVVIVQDLARGIISSHLADAYVTCLFSVTLPQESDSIFFRNAKASLFLDSLYELPLSADSLVTLASGKQIVNLHTKIPVDSRLFKIPEIKFAKIRGNAFFSFEKDSSPITLPINFDKEFSKEEKRTLFESAREKLLHSLVGDWVQSILP